MRKQVQRFPRVPELTELEVGFEPKVFMLQILGYS